MKLVVRFFWYLGLIIGLSVGTIQAQSTYPCLDSLPIHIVVLGSSTAAGAGASASDSAWVNRYRAHLQGLNPSNRLTNLARGGYNTFHLMPDGFQPPANKPAPDTLRNISQALSLQPDGIIINLPSNDAATGNTAAVQMANFRAMTDLAHSQGVAVWVCTTQPRNFNASSISIQLATRDSILAYYDTFALDFWTGLADTSGQLLGQYNSGDGVHLNDAGHRLIFERARDADIPTRLAQPGTAPTYSLVELLTDRSCAGAFQPFAFVVQNVGAPGPVNWLLEMGLTGDSLLYQSYLGTPLPTCRRDTVFFFVDVSDGGNWALSATLRPADASGIVYDFWQEDLQLIAISPPSASDTALCAGEPALLTAFSGSGTDSLHWYADQQADSVIGTGTSYMDLFESDTTLWVSTIGGPFDAADSLFTVDTFDRSWNGIMIDLIATEAVTLDSLSLPFSESGVQELVLRYKHGSHRGFEGSPQLWTLWDSLTIDAVNNVPNTFQTVVPQSMSVQAGDTIGVYVHLYPDDRRIRYLGIAAETATEAGGLKLVSGTGISHTFGATFYPRQINATFFYTRRRGYCESRRIPVSVHISHPRPDLGVDTVLGVGDSLQLMAPSGFDYFWSTGDTTQAILLAPTEADSAGFWVSLTVVDSLGCEGTDSLFVEVRVPVGIMEQVAERPFVQYSQDRQRAEIVWPGHRVEQLEVRDMQGRRIHLVQGGESILGLSDLSSGMYVVSVKAAGMVDAVAVWVW